MNIIPTSITLQPIPKQSLEERLVVESRIVAIVPVNHKGSVDVNATADRSRYVRL